MTKPNPATRAPIIERAIPLASSLPMLASPENTIAHPMGIARNPAMFIRVSILLSGSSYQSRFAFRSEIVLSDFNYLTPKILKS